MWRPPRRLGTPHCLRELNSRNETPSTGVDLNQAPLAEALIRVFGVGPEDLAAVV